MSKEVLEIQEVLENDGDRLLKDGETQNNSVKNSLYLVLKNIDR